MAGALTALLTTPFDLVNTRLQTQAVHGSGSNITGVVDTFTSIVDAEGGPPALMQGAGLRMAQYTPSALVFFFVYDAIKRLLLATI